MTNLETLGSIQLRLESLQVKANELIEQKQAVIGAIIREQNQPKVKNEAQKKTAKQTKVAKK